MEACMLFGVGLVIYALIVWLITKAKETPRNSGNGIRSGVQSAGASSTRTTVQNHRSAAARPLPPRRRDNAAAARARNVAPGPGPRGIRYLQFPCCPICHQRNDSAEQKIFWYSQENLYRCTRGHKFHANGRPFIS